MEPEPGPAVEDLPVSDFHPLLSMYPFDPPKAPAGPVAKTTEPPVEPPMEAARQARATVDTASTDLPEPPDLESPSEPLTFPLTPVMPVFRERAPESRPQSRWDTWRFRRSPDYGKMWARHGMLLSILLITLGISSYQTARVYRLFMKLEVSTLTLTPAMLLAMILASLAVLWGVSGRRYESVALAIIAMGGIFAFLGLICKVVMIAHGRV